MNRALLIISLAALAASACSKDNPTGPTVNVPFSTVDLRAGTGVEATAGRTATLRYTGWVYSAGAADNKGSQFDSGQFNFVVGSNSVIAGFNQGVTGMRVGGIRRIVIPPNLAYGSNPPPNSGIPRDATLIFEVELLSIQ